MKKLKNIIVLCILALLIVGFYYYLNQRTRQNAAEKEPQITEIEEILNKDIESAGKTPRSAVVFYSDIMKYLYNQSPDEEEIKKLGNKARELFDEELLNNNPEDSYFGDLKKELDAYADNKKIIMNYAVESGKDVEKYTEAEREYALVNASYTLRDPDKVNKTNEEYILRKDDNGLWKILGWRLSTEIISQDGNEDE